MIRVLISRKIKQREAFFRCLPEDVEVDEISFIEIEQLPFEVPNDYDWIFFSSKNGVRAFLKQAKIAENAKIGCVSAPTASALTAAGYQADYIGNPNQTTQANAKVFAEIAKGKRVVFPSSSESVRTFPSALKENCEIIEVYRPLLQHIRLEKTYDYYLFTSPTNVKAFFAKNHIPETAKIIAIGSTTAGELKKHYPHEIYQSLKPDEVSMAEKLRELFL